MNDDEQKDDFIAPSEKVEILSTDDNRIKEVGELLSNDTSRNILKLLFENEMTANQISKKTGMLLSLAIYHLQKMQRAGIVKISRVVKNDKEHDMKYYGPTNFAVIIVSSKLSDKVKKSKSFQNLFMKLSRFAAVGVAALVSWLVAQQAGLFSDKMPILTPAEPKSVPEIVYLFTVIPLVVIICGLVIERILKAYNR